MSSLETDEAATMPTSSSLHGIITPQLLHLLSTLLQEVSYEQPFETELEARQELVACLDEEYTVVQRGGTLVLMKK